MQEANSKNRPLRKIVTKIHSMTGGHKSVGCAEVRSASIANDTLRTSAHPTDCLNRLGLGRFSFQQLLTLFLRLTYRVICYFAKVIFYKQNKLYNLLDYTAT